MKRTNTENIDQLYLMDSVPGAITKISCKEYSKVQ